METLLTNDTSLSTVMDGKSNINISDSDDKYISNLSFRQNNSLKVLHNRKNIRKRDIMLNKIKDVEEKGYTHSTILNETKCSES